MLNKLRSSLAGPGYVILNVIRAINIIVFLDTIAACAVILVKIKTTNGFFFFEAVTHAIVALISSKSICNFWFAKKRTDPYTVALILSELPILRSYVTRNLPTFGDEAGFISLAVVMMIIGVSTLGNLNASSMSQKELGSTFWRIVLSAGILGMVMSLVNLVAVSLTLVSEVK